MTIYWSGESYKNRGEGHNHHLCNFQVALHDVLNLQTNKYINNNIKYIIIVLIGEPSKGNTLRRNKLHTRRVIAIVPSQATTPTSRRKNQERDSRVSATEWRLLRLLWLKITIDRWLELICKNDDGYSFLSFITLLSLKESR